MSEIQTKVLPRLAGALAGDPASLTSLELAARAVLDFLLPPIVKASDDGMASTTTADSKFWTNPFPYDVYLQPAQSVYSANGTIAASDTDYGTIVVKTDDAADGAPASAVEWKTQTTASGGTGNVATDIAKAASGSTAAQLKVKPGANVFWGITKTGSGVVMRAGIIQLVARKA